MASRADKHRCGEPFIDQPLVTFASNLGDVLAQSQPGIGTVEQVGIEFTAANPKTDRLPIINLHLPTAQDAASESRDLLPDAMATIVLRINLQRIKNRRRDPARARFVPREFHLIEHLHIQPRAR